MENRKKITNYMIFLDNKLGEGAFGKVYTGEEDETKKKVAIKILEKKKIDKEQYFKTALFSEIEILKALKSPNIVGFLDVMQSNNYYYIIQQFCNGGELRKHMKKKGKMSQQQAIALLKQICNGFVQLLRQGVMHRDLKPQNILINDGTLKIADFGFSKKGHDRELSNQTMVGTPLYMPLQILTAGAYSSKCDIWSLGCIFYQMLEAKTPWTGQSEYQLIKNISTKPLTFSVQISNTTKDFLKMCLGVQQQKRFTWDQLLRHNIFNGYFNQSKTTQFENQYKQTMNNLRYKIKVKNIDLQKYFSKIGYNKTTSMNYANFKQLLKSIDDKLSEQQIKYTFKKVNENGSGLISYEQFEKAVLKFNIPMSVYRPSTNVQFENSPNKTPSPGLKQNRDPTVFKQQTNLKVSNAFFKLDQKLKNKNMSIFQVLDAYGCSQKKYVQPSDFSRIVSVIDGSFSQQELDYSFSMMDRKNFGRISCQDFVKVFQKVTNTQAKQSSPTNPQSNKQRISNPPNFLNLIKQQIVSNPQMLKAQSNNQNGYNKYISQSNGWDL